MRYLSIDFGTKKIGLALSDESGKMAFPHSVVPNDEAFLAAIINLIAQEKIEAVVIGHSLNKDGGENPVHHLVETFIADLTLETPIPIHLEPEQFSTQQAVKLQGRNDQVDASAAAIILQSYLDRQKTNSAFTELNE